MIYPKPHINPEDHQSCNRFCRHAAFNDRLLKLTMVGASHGMGKMRSRKRHGPVPPRALFHHETIRSLWIKAADAVRHANRVFVCGYSLPVSDELIRFFLLTNAGTSPRSLYLADVRDTVSHFRERLGRGYIINGRYAGIREPIAALLLEELERGQNVG
jgi:hypothetical protein